MANIYSRRDYCIDFDFIQTIDEIIIKLTLIITITRSKNLKIEE